MTDVKNLLLTTISNKYANYPVYLQGSMSDEDVYPESFFTYWNNTTDDAAFYDNAETEIIWDIDLNFYSNDPTLVNTIFVALKPILKTAGFIVNGLGYDVLSDEISHTGRGINLLFIDRK